MCGILAIINNTRATTTKNLAAATAVISHRGPDDEGFLTWSPGDTAKIYAGKDTASSTRAHWHYPDLPPDASFKAGLGHRRLSILDLSPTGHQPMIYEKAGLAITFNGEVYNYLEIKAELQVLGHHFHSTSDTEVILHAWEEWGPECLNDFNGMFAFVILDYEKNELYACRDRFGVKPLYYYQGKNSTYFSSEIKQVRTAPDYQFQLNEVIARQFLAIGVSEHTDNTFDSNIKQVPAGHYMHVDLSTDAPVLMPEQWYTLIPHKWHGSFEDAVDKFRQLLTDSIKLRLRSDVKVGSCLSGGLESSAIVCIAAELLKAKGDFAGQETVTASCEDPRYDEWQYAMEVINKTNAHPHKIIPSFSRLVSEFDNLLWHQDEPFSTTSVFSQWSVFKATHEAGLKVMVDGQGADEQLGGYGGDDLPFYAGLLNKGHLIELYDEARYYKKSKGAWPKGFLLGAVQLNLGSKVSKLFPEKLRVNKRLADINWLSTPQPGSLYKVSAHDMSENMLRQVYTQPLPALLRFEDHNSMAWSVESRTPFMDYRLLEFNLGLPERFIYKRGVRKNIMREAIHGIIPTAIENRREKMGFISPEEMWLKGVGKEWFLDGISKACKQFDGHLLNTGKVNTYVAEVVAGKRPFDSVPWRIVCFHRWFNSI